MTPKIEDRAIFKLFDSLGPNPKHLKYVSSAFDTWEDYYKTLSRYMGFEPYYFDYDKWGMLFFEFSLGDGDEVYMDIGAETNVL